jgi:hypothetical protein
MVAVMSSVWWIVLSERDVRTETAKPFYLSADGARDLPSRSEIAIHLLGKPVATTSFFLSR